MSDAAGDEPQASSGDDSSAWKQRIDELQGRGRSVAERVERRLDALRQRSTIVDLGLRVYDRDRDAAGTLLGSALALRLFLFFVPLVLFAVGVAGIVGRFLGYESFSHDTGVAGTIGEEIDTAFDQGATAPWLASVTGLVGMAWTGRSLTRALVVSSALSWRLGGKQKTGVRAIGAVVGLMVGIGLITVILNRIREASGVALASVSFLAVAGVYLVLWLLVFQALPRATSDPGASLPGSTLAAIVLTGMQAVSVLYLPGAIERSSELYGAIGVTVATLGWFFIIGRVLAFAFSLNAVVFARIGSVSAFVFALPIIRTIPRRYSAVARYFDLEHEGAELDDS